ncbi:MAG TPA: efflux RND transporter periplasmic adaptor subunit [Chiayiivirga sp.]|nr:efflux RND transporter periplasmic adaptor subunit [Chiayiivirga sp.]
MPRSLRLLTLVLAVALSACGGASDPTGEDAAANALAVALVPVQREVLAHEVVASGQVAAWEETPLGVEVAGLRVIEVRVEVGQAVAAGEVLLRLDDRAARSDVAQARASCAEAEASLALATANLERGRALSGRGLMSAADFDQLGALRAQADARRATAEAALDAAGLRLSWTTLVAPDAGVISRRAVQPGEVVSPAAPLFHLIRQNRLEWRAQIAEGDLSRVAVGQAVRLRGAEGSIVEGRVRAVAPGLDAATRTALLQADLPAPGALRAGMVAEGRIETAQAPVLTVPLAAVVRRDGFAYVFGVDQSQRVVRHRIDTGRVFAGRIEVLAGLEEGQPVVGSGAGFLGEGDRVRVVADAP